METSAKYYGQNNRAGAQLASHLNVCSADHKIPFILNYKNEKVSNPQDIIADYYTSLYNNSDSSITQPVDSHITFPGLGPGAPGLPTATIKIMVPPKKFSTYL